MEIVGCSKERCVCFDACTSVKEPQYPPCAQNAMASVPSASNNIAMPKPESLIGACDGCKYDLPDGSEHCNDCCRCESLSDRFESPASA